MTVEARPTAVVAQATTWTEFPKLWGTLLGQVYEFVRPHPELATGDGGERWQNVMLYKDQRPDVEVGVLVSAPFQAEGPVVPSSASRWRGRDRDPPRRLLEAGGHARRGARVRRGSWARTRRPVLGDLRPCRAGPERGRDRSVPAASLTGVLPPPGPAALDASPCRQSRPLHIAALQRRHVAPADHHRAVAAAAVIERVLVRAVDA